MAIINFIPEFWSSILLERLRKALVFGQEGIINKDYEGDVRRGSAVRITSIGEVDVNTYVPDVDMADPQILSDNQLKLNIDQFDSFNFGLDDVQAKRAAGGIIPLAMSRAAYRLKDKADQFIAGLYTDASADNLIGTDAAPKVPNATAGDAQNIFNLISQATRVLDDSYVPSDGRFMIVPPFVAKILAQDLKGSPAFAYQGVMTQVAEGGLGGETNGANMGIVGSNPAPSNGFVAEIDGFRLYKSPNVNNAVTGGKTVYHVLFGDSQAITYADQIDQTENIRHPKQFKDIIRGLHVYGGKVVRPQCLGCMCVSET